MSAPRLPVAFQGELGAFSQEAARRLCGPDVAVLPCTRFEDIFRSVKDGIASGAIVPIENTLAGSVHENYDHLVNFELPIVAETSVRIVHNLIAPKGVRFSQIKRAFSHPVALNQCLDFFARNPEIEKIPFYDTAGSVKMVREMGDKTVAAVASRRAADLFGMQILAELIQDNPENLTRFLVISTQPGEPGPDAKTSIVFSLKNLPGSLFKAMSVFALRDIDLTKIESRPLAGKAFEYFFYIDFAGSILDPVVAKALAHLEEYAIFLRVFGSYPRHRYS